MINNLRNIAIIAHVDHGKTTLVDQLLQQSGMMGEHAATLDRAMDSNELEKERGITILSKNTAITWTRGEDQYRINIVDTPGHADFGGEVERILSMVDSVLLLVDAVDGPMPQTRFVTQKAFEMGFRPIVVINKVDRDGARPHWVLDQTFELFDKLGASEEQLDFPVVYASALQGYAGLEDDVRDGDMTPLFETILNEVDPPKVDLDGPFQMRVSTLDYNTYVGVIGIGRVQRGSVKPNQRITAIDRYGEQRNARILQVLGFRGLKRVEVTEARAGDIIAVTGVEIPVSGEIPVLRVGRGFIFFYGVGRAVILAITTNVDDYVAAAGRLIFHYHLQQGSAKKTQAVCQQYAEQHYHHEHRCNTDRRPQQRVATLLHLSSCQGENPV